MAHKIYCQMPDFYDSDVVVNGHRYHIGVDGYLNVADDDDAKKLLGNKAKYVDEDAQAAASKKPGKRARPQPILAEKGTGRELSAEETQAALKAAGVEDEPAEGAEGEAEETEWPSVSLASTKPELLGVLKRLKEAGAEDRDVAFDVKDTKADLLKKIEKVYKKMK